MTLLQIALRKFLHNESAAIEWLLEGGSGTGFLSLAFCLWFQPLLFLFPPTPPSSDRRS
jgi:hypothetical protein